MNLSRTLVVAAAVAVVAGSAHAQVSKQGNKYLFRIKYVKGQTITYGMAMSMNMGGKSTPMNMNVSQKVVSVDSSGTATVSVSGVGGQPMTMKMDNRGRMVGGPQGMAAGSNSIQLPEKAVAVGESWAGSAAGGQQGMGVNMTATYTLKGFKTVHGKQCAEVAITMKMTGGGTSGGKKTSINGGGGGSCFISMADGIAESVSISMKVGGSATGGAAQTATVTTTMNRK